MNARTRHKVKKTFSRLLFFWRALIVIVLSLILIPLFLRGGDSGNFYFWIIVPSMCLYIILIYLQQRFKKRIRNYLDMTGTRLFLAMVTLAAAFLCTGFHVPVWANTFLVMAAVLYALFLQRLGFLRWFLI